jgi:hypothetical protein
MLIPLNTHVTDMHVQALIHFAILQITEFQRNENV